MFAGDLLPLSDTAHLHFELSDLEWAATTAQPAAGHAGESYSQDQAVSPNEQQSNSSGSSAEESLDENLPADWGVHILTLLSKTRSPLAEPPPAASANAADTAYQTSSAQDQSDPQTTDRAVKTREKNKRSQKRHRDRIKVGIHMLTCICSSLQYLFAN